MDTTPLGRVLGEVIVTDEEEVALLAALTAVPLPHPVKIANAPSDSAPNATLIKINIPPI